MVLIYSIKKAFKLRRISKILHKRNAGSLLTLMDIPRSDLLEDQKKYIGAFKELLDFCETDRFIKREMEFYKVVSGKKKKTC